MENRQSLIHTDSSSTSPIIAHGEHEYSLNDSTLRDTTSNTKNPFHILSICSPSFKVLHPRSYTHHRSNLVQPYPISPQTYFATMTKYAQVTTGINSTSANNHIMCSVCGDIASGKHYGILACNGCSGFFKRSVRRKLIYRCQTSTGQCIIDKAHRNQCQACRLKKCLHMGMLREAVQNERQRRDSAQRRVASIDYHHDDDSGRTLFERHPRSPQETNFISGLSPSENAYDLVDPTVGTISSQILLMMIKWLRNLPTFANLSIDDQLILIEDSWSELFLLWAIQCSISLDNGGPLFNHTNDREKENGQLLDDIFQTFKQLNLHPVEFVCLKSIILFRFDIRTLREAKSIENRQDQAQLTLAQFIQLHHPTQPARFGRLLLTLPLLRSIPSIFIEKTYFSRTIGPTSMSKILFEMFKN